MQTDQLLYIQSFSSVWFNDAGLFIVNVTHFFPYQEHSGGEVMAFATAGLTMS